MIHASIVRPGELTTAEVETWRALQEAQPGLRSPLLTPEFALAVSRARDDAAVAVFRREGRTVGFLAHHRRPGGFARPIGAVWSDYQALIAEPGAALDGGELLTAAGIRALRFGGLLDPDGVFELAEAATHDAYAVVLTDGGEAYWESRRALSAKRFKNIRRLESKLEREVGPVELIAPDASAETFEQMLSWKREQFRSTGLHDVLQADWSRKLMHTLFETRTGLLQGLMLTLTVAGRPVAMHFGVRHGVAFHPWIAAFSPEFAAYSPGWIFMSRAVLAMPGLGLSHYDFSGGHEHYKLPLASDQVEVRTGVARSTTPTASLDGALALAGRALGERRAPLVARVRRRLDHIAAVELSLAGRLHGVAHAIAKGGRRHAPEAES